MRTRLAALLKPTVVALTALLLIGGTAAVASSAAAKPKRYASQVSLELTDSMSKGPGTPFAFEGDVSSKVKPCERGRRIELTRKSNLGSEPFGEASTDSKGHYEIPQASYPPRGRYTAKVLREKKGEKVCKAAVSKQVKIEQT